MGFCRRCGDIVSGARCKCGGTAVAPVIQWTSSSKGTEVDKWSQTYVAREKSSTRPHSRGPPEFDSLPNDCQDTAIYPPVAKRFPRPNSTASSQHRPSTSLSNRVSAHIVSATTRPPSPLKHSTSLIDDEPPSSPSAMGILPSPYAPELSKAYGSVLQPKESLASYRCAICSTEFPPDATIYPDPTVSNSSLKDRFLCRSCFVINGGSKGDCPTCYRPVLILKSEGGFVETSGRVWHKRCFRCEGCGKHIGDTPMVDLVGRPSCADCFDSCLKRDRTPRKNYDSPDSDKGKLNRFRNVPVSGEDNRCEGIEQRVTNTQTRESSPVLEELTQRLNAVLNRTPTKDSPSLRSLPSDVANHEVSPLVHHARQRTRSILDFNTPATPRSEASTAHHSPNLLQRHRTGDREALVNLTFPQAIESSPPAKPPTDAIEEMKRRFIRQSSSSPSQVELYASSSTASSPPSTSLLQTPPVKPPVPSRIPVSKRLSASPRLRHSMSTSSLGSPRDRLSWIPSTPDLMSDFSDTTTQSSGPSSPPFNSPQTHANDIFNSGHKSFLREEITDDLDSAELSSSGSTYIKASPPKTPKLGKISIPAATLSPGSLCAKCGGSLFTNKAGGRFVTVPEPAALGPPKTYHTECFRCTMCDGPFKETSSGQAVFVRGEGGACHIECAPPERIGIKSTAISSPITPAFSPVSLPPFSSITNTPAVGATPSPTLATHNSPYSSSRYERPPPTVSTPFPRFGSSTACPGCHKSVSPMEMGVVPGPQGSKWHATCLVCGGKGINKGRRDKGQPGCGKRLDSAAKRDKDGGVWCRECLLLLPTGTRNLQTDSPVKPLAPSFTGRSAGSRSIVPQFTGTTTIARQFTGLRGVDGGMVRQLTGGGLSPTRQLSSSPTKQLGNPPGVIRPRPKSVIGMRSGKSVDEGRGMFLVRQMTGGGGSFGS
ncbi:hypothetical protein BJ138DRAFT_1077635 [Hygrophoropsis aurantiaca]|uniref:Uncharacterized protein n=1 Tax=Hygrophoropsis aurantiaca TaxID=72124 RepID=A0ACB8ASR0_9AGAM|nr:hypothetical protein BJ138DRAFT_1077635 [Hygrophoropsis aurantiaca]